MLGCGNPWAINSVCVFFNMMDSFSLIIKSMASIYSHSVAQLVLRDFKNKLQETRCAQPTLSVWRQQKGPGDLGPGFRVLALTLCCL